MDDGSLQRQYIRRFHAIQKGPIEMWLQNPDIYQIALSCVSERAVTIS